MATACCNVGMATATPLVVDLRDAQQQITLRGFQTLCMKVLKDFKRLLRLVAAKQQSGQGNGERGVLRIEPHRLAQIMESFGFAAPAWRSKSCPDETAALDHEG